VAGSTIPEPAWEHGRKPQKTQRRDRSEGRDSKPGHPEYDAGMLFITL